MNKLALIALMPCAMLISACSSMSDSNGWDNLNFNNQAVNSILIPGQYGPATHYQQPRQYYVTQEDEQEYNAINDRVQQRQQQLQHSTSASSMITSTSAASTITNNADAYSSAYTSGTTNSAASTITNNANTNNIDTSNPAAASTITNNANTNNIDTSNPAASTMTNNANKNNVGKNNSAVPTPAIPNDNASQKSTQQDMHY